MLANELGLFGSTWGGERGLCGLILWLRKFNTKCLCPFLVGWPVSVGNWDSQQRTRNAPAPLKWIRDCSSSTGGLYPLSPMMMIMCNGWTEDDEEILYIEIQWL